MIKLIGYGPLRALMARRKITFETLREDIKMGPNAAVKLKNDSGYVALEVIDRICNYFQCPLNEVMEHIRTEK
jgi:putative transcriptional regulator